MNLIDDPDVRKWLDINEPGGSVAPDVAPAGYDPDVLAYAGLPAAQSPDQVARFNQGQPDYVKPAVTPGPEAYLQSGQAPGPSPQIQSFVDAVKKQASPEPTERLIDPVPRVPGSLNEKAEDVAQSRLRADEEALNARENQFRMEREALAKRKGEIEAERQQRQEEMERQERTNQDLRKQESEIAAEKDQPINPDRYMQNLSAGATLLAAASAFAYGFMNPNAQSNPIAGIISQNIDRDIASQKADLDAGQERRTNRLAVLRQQLGSGEVAIGRLRIEQANLVDKHLDVLEKDDRAAIDQAGLGAARAQADAQRKQGQFEMQKGLYALRAKAKGAGVDPLAREKKIADLTKSWNDQNVPPEEQRARLEQMGLGGAVVGKNKSKVESLTSDEKKDLRVRLDGFSKAALGFEEMDKAAGIERAPNGDVKNQPALPGVGPVAGRIKTGSLISDDGAAVNRAAEKITTGQAHAESGASTTESELERYAARLPVTNETDFKRASGELWREHRQSYQNLVGQYGEAAVDAELRQRGIDPEQYKAGAASNPYGGTPR